MYFVFTLVSWDIDLGNIDLLDTHLDLLVTGIPSKHFVCLQEVLKTSSRPVFKTSSRRLQRNNFSSSKTSSRRLVRFFQDVFKTSLQNVFKTSWRPLERQKLLRWRRIKDVLKSNKCLLGTWQKSTKVLQRSILTSDLVLIFSLPFVSCANQLFSFLNNLSFPSSSWKNLSRRSKMDWWTKTLQ